MCVCLRARASIDRELVRVLSAVFHLYFLAHRLASLPASPAAPNWAHYRSIVTAPGFVDSVQKTVRAVLFGFMLNVLLFVFQ